MLDIKNIWWLLVVIGLMTLQKHQVVANNIDLYDDTGLEGRRFFIYCYLPVTNKSFLGYIRTLFCSDSFQSYQILLVSALLPKSGENSVVCFLHVRNKVGIVIKHRIAVTTNDAPTQSTTLLTTKSDIEIYL